MNKVLNGFEWGEAISAIFLLLGSVLLLVAVYQHRQARKLQKVLLELYALNNKVLQDTLKFTSQAWPILSKNDFESIFIDLNWYGEAYQQKFGHEASQKYAINIEDENVDGSVLLTTRRLFNEQKLIVEMIVQTVKVILKSNVSAQVKQVLLSQKRLEDYQLFVQHDTKNIAQFIGLLESLVMVSETDEAKIKLVDRLKIMLPSLVYKAERVTAPIGANDTNLLDIERLSLAETLQEASDAIELDCQIKGDAQLEISKGLLEVVINNLLDNFKKHIEGAFVTIKIDQTDDEVIIKFLQTQSIVHDKIETIRMFQPFWTTSKSGLGLGLFITRSSLKKIGGSIAFISEKESQGFEIVLPKQPS